MGISRLGSSKRLLRYFSTPAPPGHDSQLRLVTVATQKTVTSVAMMIRTANS